MQARNQGEDDHGLVIEAGIRANPWSLAGTAFSQFAVAYPGNNAAAIAAYWASCTESLLRFEQAHPDACHRARYEDLASDRELDGGKILAFLDLAQDPSASPHDTTPIAEEPGITGHEAEIPAGLIPPALKAQVDDLHTRIGYPPLLLTSAGYAGDHPGPA